jgi:hypothetical protein
MYRCCCGCCRCYVLRWHPTDTAPTPLLQAQRQDAEIQRLTAALAAAPREDPAAPNTRQALQKMAAEVSSSSG